MKSLNKRTESLYFFIFITLVPLLGIIIIFSYAFFHVRGDVKFLSHELKGLKVISQIEKTIFDIQRLRGLSSLKNPNENSIEKLKESKKKISDDLVLLRHISLTVKDDMPFKDELIRYIDKIKNTQLEEKERENLTYNISKLMLFSNRIAYHCKLILDSDLGSYVLIDNVVYLLPELIEYSGQIRAMASGIDGNVLTPAQKEQIIIQQDKIKERLSKLNYNKLFVYEKENRVLLEQSHRNIIETQNKVVKFTENRLLGTSEVLLNPDNIFILITKNIDSMIQLYDSNLNLLSNTLEKRLKESEQLSVIVLFAGLISFLFIVFINKVFYRKNREHIDKIEELTIIDSMTSLYNRRYFDEIFDNFLKIQKRTNKKPIFVILDIDFFKQYNDTYGHQKGDEAIKVVAKSLKNSLKRAGDMAFRLGGEEFGILCTEESSEQAISFADSIRKMVEDEKVEHSKSSVSEYLTISMGVIIIEEETTGNISDIYKHADAALYKAKEEGRNRVVAYSPGLFGVNTKS